MIPDWLGRIAVGQRLQFPSMVVARAAVRAAGWLRPPPARPRRGLGDVGPHRRPLPGGLRAGVRSLSTASTPGRRPAGFCAAGRTHATSGGSSRSTASYFDPATAERVSRAALRATASDACSRSRRLLAAGDMLGGTGAADGGDSVGPLGPRARRGGCGPGRPRRPRGGAPGRTQRRPRARPVIVPRERRRGHRHARPAGVARRCLDSLLVGHGAPPRWWWPTRAQVRAPGTCWWRTGARGMPVRWVHGGADGLAGAQNAAFRHGSAPVVAVIDDDCVADPGWIAKLGHLFAADPRLALVAGRVLPLEPAGARRHPVSSRTAAARRELRGKAMPWLVGSGNNFAVRREWFERVGGCDARLGPGTPGQGALDMDLFYRILRGGGPGLLRAAARWCTTSAPAPAGAGSGAGPTDTGWARCV